MVKMVIIRDLFTRKYIPLSKEDNLEKKQNPIFPLACSKRKKMEAETTNVSHNVAWKDRVRLNIQTIRAYKKKKNNPQRVYICQQIQH